MCEAWKAAVLAITLALAAHPAAAEKYPDRQIRMVVPYPAGGTSDQVARALAIQLGKELGQTVFIDNKSGGTGTIGALDVARAKPDGYTLMVTEQTFAVSPAIFNVKKFDPVADFTPISLVVTSPMMLVVNKDTPYKTLQDLIAAARKDPGAIDYGAGGYGGALHLAFERLGQEAGAKFTVIPYKGSGETMGGLLSGQVKAMLSGVPSVAGQVRSGLVRGLAVTGTERLAAMPDVPTFAQAGLPSFDVLSWFGVLGPAKMDPAIVQRLNLAIRNATAKPGFIEAMKVLGATPTPDSPVQFKAYLAKEVDQWSRVAKTAGIEPL